MKLFAIATFALVSFGTFAGEPPQTVRCEQPAKTIVEIIKDGGVEGSPCTTQADCDWMTGVTCVAGTCEYTGW